MLREEAHEQFDDDLNSAIRSLNDLHLGSGENLHSDIRKCDGAQGANLLIETTDPVTMDCKDTSAPQDAADWVELFVNEILCAQNMDDAKNRAFRGLELLEKSIYARVFTEAAQSLQQNNVLKEQLEATIQQNIILKRAVSIQHQHQKDFEDMTHELHNLKQLLSQYQEQLKTLEIKNYALALQLKQALQSSSLPGPSSPDVI